MRKLIVLLLIVAFTGAGCATRLAPPAPDAATWGAPVHPKPAETDQDSLYLSLKARHLEDLTQREYDYFMAHERAQAMRPPEKGRGSVVGTAIVATVAVVGTLALIGSLANQ